MSGLNSVVIAGRLTKEPELRKTASGLSYMRFTVAVDRVKKDSGADFITCVAWRQAADFLSQYADKGTMVGVTGNITTGSYDDKQTGKKVYTTEVTADRVTILESKKQRSDYPNSGTSLRVSDITFLEEDNAGSADAAPSEDGYEDVPW